MKRLLVLLSALLIVMLMGCGESSANTKSGEIVSFSKSPGRMEFKGEDGKHYGFVIDETTELVWKDEKLYPQLVEEAKSVVKSEIEIEYDEWDFVNSNMQVMVESGEKSIVNMYLSNDHVVDCYMAKTITVIGLGEAYINPYTDF